MQNTSSLSIFNKTWNGTQVNFIQHPTGKYKFGIAAKHIAEVLDAHSGKDIARSVDPDYKGKYKLNTPGGVQLATVVWQPGIFELLLVSRKEKAKPFKKWLCETFLPNSQDAGFYSTSSTNIVSCSAVDSPSSTAELLLHAAQILVQHEKQLALQNNRLDAIEARLNSADNYVETSILPVPTVEVPKKDLRTCLNQLVRGFAHSNGSNYRDVWHKLYAEYKYRYHTDITTLAKNRGMERLDYCAQQGYIPNLYAVAYKIFCTDKQQTPAQIALVDTVVSMPLDHW